MNDKLGKKIRKCRRIAVNALDHLARGVRVVKAHIEIEAMMRERIPHLIRCAPAHVLPEIRTHNLHTLANNANGEKGNTRPYQILHGTICLRRINKISDDLRIQQIETNTGKHENAKKNNALPMRAKIVYQEGGIMPERDAFQEDSQKKKKNRRPKRSKFLKIKMSHVNFQTKFNH